MRRRMGYLMWLSAVVMPSYALAQAPISQGECPAGRTLRPPDYPVEMIKRGIAGSVVLDLTIDSCGRVLGAKVKQGDKPAFNKAALASVQGITLTSSQRVGVVDGHVDLPVDFKLSTLSYQVVDWPTTHKRPRYVLDDAPIPYTTPDMANVAIRTAPDQVWPSPYAVKSRFVQTGEPGAREFWLFVSKDAAVNLAVHYRPVFEGGEPVVKVALLCSDTSEACAKAQETLMGGLPYAKAKRP